MAEDHRLFLVGRGAGQLGACEVALDLVKRGSRTEDALLVLEMSLVQESRDILGMSLVQDSLDIPGVSLSPACY